MKKRNMKEEMKKQVAEKECENEGKCAAQAKCETEEKCEAQETGEAQKTGETQETGECAEESQVQKLRDRVAELQASAEKEHDNYIRLYAEFDNFRRRSTQEKLDLVSVAAKETIMGLLPVLDDCERAIDILRKSEDSPAAKEGTELIYNKLLSYLKSKGLAVIEARGELFNTDLHEAVAQFPAPEESSKGHVIDVIQTGYTLSGKVIRYAKVVVGI